MTSPKKETITKNFQIALPVAVLVVLLPFFIVEIFRDQLPANILLSVLALSSALGTSILSFWVFKRVRNINRTTVFLSYGHADKELAHKLAYSLNGLGIKVLSFADEVRPGESISARIRSIMKRVDSVVLLISDRSAKSEWISKEVETAQDLGKRIYPVVYNDASVPPSLRDVMQIYASDSVDETAEQIAEALRSYYRPTSQHDLSRAMSADLQVASGELERILHKLLEALEGEDKDDLIKAQDAWKRYAESQATFAAGTMRGGTGAGILYLDEMQTLTRARVADLKRALDEKPE